MSRVAIVVAMQREIIPLVRGWTRVQLSGNGRSFPGYEKGEVLVIAGGIGGRQAEQAARTAAEKCSPETLISAGLAGALIRSLKVGNIVLPSVIVDAIDGTEYRCDPVGNAVIGGVLVSAPAVAGMDSKAKLVEKFHALVVDMEAAGVARVARERGVKFQCVKAISDEFDFPMPPLARFIDTQNKMQTAKFVRWTAVRPQYWAATARLARNSRHAAAALADWLSKNLASKLSADRVATLDTADHVKT